ncbi:MAG: peptide-methionine (S)-S-oxide reductase MsrA [Syntrophotaleaceae bacterium]
MNDQLEVATLAAGCFWCVEAVFSQLRGVINVVSGYAGGNLPNPGYREVCSGRTGHAEAVQIRFDPQIISFAELLEIFWRSHDPTTLNRQGADVGTQYRSAIFFHNEEQRKIAEKSKANIEKILLWPDPITTEIVPFTAFYPAEDYHQDYYRLNPDQMYCRMVIDPKIQKLRKDFAEKVR